MLHRSETGWLDIKVWLFFTLLFTSVPAWLAASGPDFSRMAQLAELRYGFGARESVSLWRTLIQNNSVDINSRLQKVNQFFNQRIIFNTDQEIWGYKDYWSTPLQTLGRQQGDCEDFSIAKYTTLLLMGIPSDQLRLVYVKATINTSGVNQKQAHMVVAYYAKPNAEPLILDNLKDEILPARLRPDLKPVYSFNSTGLWVGGGANAVSSHPEQRLSRWRDVLTRMQEEGL